MPTQSQETIGRRIREYRKQLGLSQDEVAYGICSRQTISLLENGQHFPSAEIVQKILERLRVPVHEVLLDETKALDTKIQIDIVKIYMESGDYAHGHDLIEELLLRDDLLLHQQRDLALCRAVCLTRLGEILKGIEILEAMKQELEQQRESDDHFMATLYDKLGTAYYLQANHAKAHVHYSRAYQLTLRFPEMDQLAAGISYNLGMVCFFLNQLDEATEYLSIAHQFYAKTSNTRNLADTLFTLGIACRENNELQRAGSYLQESLTLYQAMNHFASERMARSAYAFMVLSQTNHKQAIEELVSCAQEYEKVGDKLRLAYTNARAAELCLKNGEIELASNLLEYAFHLFSNEEGDADPRCAYFYRVYAMYLYERKEVEKAVEYAFRSSEIFDKIGLPREAAESLRVTIAVPNRNS